MIEQQELNGFQFLGIRNLHQNWVYPSNPVLYVIINIYKNLFSLFDELQQIVAMVDAFPASTVTPNVHVQPRSFQERNINFNYKDAYTECFLYYIKTAAEQLR